MTVTNQDLVDALRRVIDCECCQGKTLDRHTCDITGARSLLEVTPQEHAKHRHHKAEWLLSKDVEGAIVPSYSERENLLGLDVEGYAIVIDKKDAALMAAALTLYNACIKALEYISERTAGSSETWDAINLALRKADLK